MKRILFSITFFLIILNLNAQCNLPYKSFDQFSNDTTAFLRYNFKNRASCYVNKYVSTVLRDLQLLPKSFVPIPSNTPGKYNGIRIHVDATTTNTRSRLSSHNLKVHCIHVMFSFKDYEELVTFIQEYDNDKWVQKHYDYFKDFVVSEVGYYR